MQTFASVATRIEFGCAMRISRPPVLRNTACGHGTTSTNIHGYDPVRGRRFICIDGVAGGMGGRNGHDGMDAVQINTNNIPNLPTEILESEYPIRIDRYELVPDSGGAGRFRGGLAARKDFRMRLLRETPGCPKVRV